MVTVKRETMMIMDMADVVVVCEEEHRAHGFMEIHRKEDRRPCGKMAGKLHQDENDFHTLCFLT